MERSLDSNASDLLLFANLTATEHASAAEAKEFAEKLVKEKKGYAEPSSGSRIVAGTKRATTARKSSESKRASRTRGAAQATKEKDSKGEDNKERGPKESNESEGVSPKDAPYRIGGPLKWRLYWNAQPEAYDLRSMCATDKVFLPSFDDVLLV